MPCLPVIAPAFITREDNRQGSVLSTFTFSVHDEFKNVCEIIASG